MMYLAFKLFRKNIEENGFKCPKLKEHLRVLCTIYGLDMLKQDCGALYQSGYFSGPESKLVFEGLKVLIAKIRPQFIPLVEAMDIPDSILCSAIGNSYGDIYE